MVITFHRLPNTPPRDLILRGTVCWNLESTMFHWETIPDRMVILSGFDTIENYWIAQFTQLYRLRTTNKIVYTKRVPVCGYPVVQNVERTG